jgi:mRNA interferase MazF
MVDPRHGEIWTADMPGEKRRPVVILTRQDFIKRLTNVTVAPVLSKIRNIPTEVVLGESHGLDHRSAANLDNILTIPKEVLLRRIGRLSAEECVEICAATALALGCQR